MSALPYMRIRGTVDPTGQTGPFGYVIPHVNISDNGAAVSPDGYTVNPSGAFEIIIHRPGGFTMVDVAIPEATYNTGMWLEVGQIEITDDPFGTGEVQSRQVVIYGSQRTELSLAVLGLDGAGTTPVGLGEQVLIHTAAAGGDGRAKFLAVRALAGVSDHPDSTATSGYYSDLPPTSSPTPFTIPASALLPGNYVAVARLRHTLAAANLPVSLRAHVTTSSGQSVYDPPTGWRSAPITVVASGAVWPQMNVNTWCMIPVGLLRLPPADIEDPAATITIEAACSVAVDLDDIYLCNADVGQASLMLTTTSTGSFSAVRLDAATVDHPLASGWVGVANGAMVADPSRWIGEQHQAAPGLLQIGTVTPGCGTSRVSGTYYARNHTNTVAGG